jgi:hypothetical protein
MSKIESFLCVIYLVYLKNNVYFKFNYVKTRKIWRVSLHQAKGMTEGDKKMTN